MIYQNRHSLGKKLRAFKRLRRTDPNAKQLKIPAHLQEYIDFLKAKGLSYNKLTVGQFQTRNGLQFSGLICTQKLLSNQIFIRVPKDLLLNTRNAFFSDVKIIFQQNPNIFHEDFRADWQDRILLVFLLYQNQKGRESSWYHIIRNLPKEIDYLCYWEQQEMTLLQDPKLKQYASHLFKQFNKDYEQIKKCLSKYPQFFKDPQAYSYQNARWIQIHLNSRCFGKYFAYVTMVPFAQLLNHQCSDVYYDFFYKEDNPHNPHQTFNEPKQLSQQQIDNNVTSQGSYFSSGDQVEDSFGQVQIKYQKEFNQLKRMASDIRFYVNSFINFDDSISYLFIDKIYSRLQTADEVEMAVLQNQCKSYFKEVSIFYKIIKGHKFKYQESLVQKKKTKTQVTKKEGHQFKVEEDWDLDKFDQFVMKCSSKDQFQPGSQIFYCYGHLSNRSLLLRYGIALQHNKYNHYWLRIGYLDSISSQILRQQIQYYNCKKQKKIKLKRTKLCNELMVWTRLRHWKPSQSIEEIFQPCSAELQTRFASQCMQIIQKEINKFPNNLQFFQKSMKNEKRGYHQHFADIYVLENLRILHFQFTLFRLVALFNARQAKGELFQQSLRIAEFENEQWQSTNRFVMKNYLQKLRRKRSS